jgi:hypothetical protein
MITTIERVPDSLNEDQAAPDPSVVRAWAASQGITVGKRGRLPASLVSRYVRSTSSSM